MSTSALMTRPDATTWSIDDILRKAREGELFVPVFQRSYRWDTGDIEKLFDSVYHGYPISNLLLWETENQAGAKTQFGDLYYQPAEGKQLLIIDGQQRVSSFVAVLNGSENSESKFRLLFDLDNDKFTYRSDASAVLPLYVISDTMQFLEWLQRSKLTAPQVYKANQMVRALRDYRVPVYIVKTSDDAAIREIFNRTNAAGKSLRPSEVFDALQRGRPVGGHDLKSLSDFTVSLGFGRVGEEWCLKAVASLLQIDVTHSLSEALHKKTEPARQQAIADTEIALRKAVHFLRDEVGLPHIAIMPYQLPLVVLTKLFHFIPSPSEALRRKLIVWVWQGAQSGEHQRKDSASIRPVLRAITHDEQDVLKALTPDRPQTLAEFVVPAYRYKAASTKLTCAALAALSPRHLLTGAAIDIANLFEEQGADACMRIAPGDDAAVRILHPPIESISSAIMNASNEVLMSHLINQDAKRALLDHRDSLFIKIRKESLQHAVSKFLQEHS